MALLGCGLIGLDDPRSPEQIKKLIVYVKMDRCAADAVGHVTGVRLGRRSLKFVDCGIMAASFVNLETGEAYRIVSTEKSRDFARSYAPEFAGTAALIRDVTKRWHTEEEHKKRLATLEVKR